MENVYRIHMGKARCAVDLGDGSERICESGLYFGKTGTAAPEHQFDVLLLSAG